MSPLLANVGGALADADHIANGLEQGPIRYVAALSLLVNLGLFAILMRVQSLRIADKEHEAERSEKLGAIIEKHNQAMNFLERAIQWVMAQQPRKKRGDTGSFPALGPEPQTSKGGKP